MKKLLKQILCLALTPMLLCCMTACGSSGSGSDAGSDTGSDAPGTDTGLTEKISLSFSHHDSSTSVIGTYWQDWADAIAEDSDGMIEITVYASAALAAPADGINALNSGVCDILWTSTGFFSGQFPVTDSITMPFNGITNAIQGTYVLNDAYDSIPALQQEWTDKGLKVLFLNTAPASYLLTNVEIRSPGDSQGKTLRAMSGLPTQLLSTMGASAVVSPSGEIFTSMEKGILQGTIFDLAGARGFNLFEVSDYLLDMPLYCTVVPVVMLQSTWDSLPAAAQEIISARSGLDGAIDFAEKYQAYAAEYYDKFAAANRLVSPSAAEQSEWDELASTVSTDWIAKNTTSSVDYPSVVGSVAAIIEDYADVTAPLS